MNGDFGDGQHQHAVIGQEMFIEGVAEFEDVKIFAENIFIVHRPKG